MLNGPFVHDQAGRWGKRIAEADSSPSERMTAMFQQATARVPDVVERAMLQQLVEELRATPRTEEDLWTEIAHVFFNLDEFIVIE
jgi:hypothetical protein